MAAITVTAETLGSPSRSAEVVEDLDIPIGSSPAPRGPLGPSRLELNKPVIGAIEGPAVAGGMELALWCDIRVMAETAYLGVYCRRWGIPLLARSRSGDSRCASRRVLMSTTARC